MNVPFVDLSKQHHALEQEFNQAIQKVIKQNNYVLGDEVNYFEEEFAAYCGVSYAIGTDSGLSALTLSLLAHDIGPNDEVIVPAHTFIATAAAVTFAGACPVLVDVDPTTYNIDVSMIEAAITPRTKAIIPVHLYGLPAEMDSILDIAKAHNLIVIEDAAQAHGAQYKNKRVGSFGHAAAFSFYPAKNLGAFGDGGIVVTNNAAVAERVRAMRNCGQKRKYYHELPPYNHRLDTLQAAVLRIKLRHLDEWNAQRRQSAHLYNEYLVETGVITPLEPPSLEHVYHLYVIRHPDRDRLQAYLKEQGVGTGIHYPVPVHQQPVYQERRSFSGTFPITDRICNDILSLPMFPFMKDEQIRYVVQHIAAFAAETVVS